MVHKIPPFNANTKVRYLITLSLVIINLFLQPSAVMSSNSCSDRNFIWCLLLIVWDGGCGVTNVGLWNRKKLPARSCLVQLLILYYKYQSKITFKASNEIKKCPGTWTTDNTIKDDNICFKSCCVAISTFDVSFNTEFVLVPLNCFE